MTTKTTKTTKTTTEQWVVVATGSRPWLVACGRLISQTDTLVELADARCAVYYSRPTRSVFGLASHGPDDGCRISRACTRVVLRYEMIADSTPEAIEAWSAEPWPCQ